MVAPHFGHDRPRRPLLFNLMSAPGHSRPGRGQQLVPPCPLCPESDRRPSPRCMSRWADNRLMHCTKIAKTYRSPRYVGRVFLAHQRRETWVQRSTSCVQLSRLVALRRIAGALCRGSAQLRTDRFEGAAVLTTVTAPSKSLNGTQSA